MSHQFSIPAAYGICLALLLALPNPVNAAATEAAVDDQSPLTVFRNIHLITMESDEVLDGQIVAVSGDRIIHVGPADEYETPDNARTIDGNGGYLIPGIADMHAHPDLYDEEPGHLVGFLAHGVTTVRSPGSVGPILDWREAVASGDLPGPTILAAGSLVVGLPGEYWYVAYASGGAVLATGIALWLLTWLGLKIARRPSALRVRRAVPKWLGAATAAALLVHWLQPISLQTMAQLMIVPHADVVVTAEEARRSVEKGHAAGYDFIKVYDWLGEDAFLAALDEASRRDMYVAGHLVDFIPLETSLSSGLPEVAHVDEFLSHHWIGYDPVAETWREEDILPDIDYDSIHRTVELVHSNNVSVVSNLVTDEIVYKLLEDLDGLLTQPEYAVVRPSTITTWRTEGRGVNWKGQEDYRRDVGQPFLKTMVKALHDAGVTITVGSDISVEGMVPGFHTLRDIEILQEAGFTPFEALKAGTVNAATVVARMNKDARWGTIAQGQRADLVLLASNPLVTVKNLHDRQGVMVRGVWYTQAQLDGLVDDYIATFYTN